MYTCTQNGQKAGSHRGLEEKKFLPSEQNISKSTAFLFLGKVWFL